MLTPDAESSTRERSGSAAAAAARPALIVAVASIRLVRRRCS
jgi:hypothetical protein